MSGGRRGERIFLNHVPSYDGSLTCYDAKAIVKDAMEVIVAGIVSPSYDIEKPFLLKSDVVGKVDDKVIRALERAIRDNTNEERGVWAEYAMLAKEIRDFNLRHMGYIGEEVKPERWMFRGVEP